jgi:glycosyltransferase involved in cell wall biosynthesis
LRTSVIITVYNLEGYISEALNSVLDQTHFPDEIIVIDDCSTDRSPALVKEFGDRIKYVRNEENLGVLLSTIKGIRMAGGDVITFLDGDDIWEKTKLEKVVNFFREYENCIMVTHHHEYIDANGKFIGKTDMTHHNIESVIKRSGGDVLRRSDLLRESILGYKGVWLGSAYCLRKKFFDVEKFERWVTSSDFPSARLSYQDHPIAQFLVLEQPKGLIGFLNEPLLKYRIYGKNSSGASYSLQTALHTINKLEATTMRTYALVKDHNQPALIQNVQKLKLYEVEYLKALYNKKYGEAFKYYSRLAQSKWSIKESSKELMRFLGFMLLSKKLFFKLKSSI